MGPPLHGRGGGPAAVSALRLRRPATPREREGGGGPRGPSESVGVRDFEGGVLDPASFDIGRLHCRPHSEAA